MCASGGGGRTFNPTIHVEVKGHLLKYGSPLNSTMSCGEEKGTPHACARSPHWAKAKGAGVQYLCEWYAEIWPMTLQEHGFCLQFYFLVTWSSCLRVRNLVGLDRDRDTRLFGSFPIYTTYWPPLKIHLFELWFCLFPLLAAVVVSPCRALACTGDRESRSPEPLVLAILHQEKVNKVFGKRLAWFSRSSQWPVLRLSQVVLHTVIFATSYFDLYLATSSTTSLLLHHKPRRLHLQTISTCTVIRSTFFMCSLIMWCCLLCCLIQLVC
jgi:hypothetical protein